MSFDSNKTANEIILAHYNETGEDLLSISDSNIPEIILRHFHEEKEGQYYGVLAALSRLKLKKQEATNFRTDNSF